MPVTCRRSINGAFSILEKGKPGLKNSGSLGEWLKEAIAKEDKSLIDAAFL